MIVYSLIIISDIGIISDHIRYYPSAFFSQEIAEDHSIPMRKEIELDFEAVNLGWFAARFLCEKLDKFLKVSLIIKRRYDVSLHPHVRTSSKDARLDLFLPKYKVYQPSPVTIKALRGSRRTSLIVESVIK